MHVKSEECFKIPRRLFQFTMDLNFGHTIDIEQNLVSLLIESLLGPEKIGKVIVQYCLQFFMLSLSRSSLNSSFERIPSSFRTLMCFTG